MDIKKFHRLMKYDEFGNKDYEGYLLAVLMLGYICIMILGFAGWLICLI